MNKKERIPITDRSRAFYLLGYVEEHYKYHHGEFDCLLCEAWEDCLSDIPGE